MSLARSSLHPAAIADLADADIWWHFDGPFAPGADISSLYTNGEKLTIPSGWLQPGMQYTFSVTVKYRGLY